MIEFDAESEVTVSVTLNGRTRQGRARPRMQLADFLRHVLRAYGTHVGCEHGVCGACTILVDGRAVRSCMIFAVQVDGADIRTIEGLAPSGDKLTVLQSAMRRNYALQCGFCTPGILMSCVQFLQENPDPDEATVRDMLSGHLCRCTGYDGIVRAILEAAEGLPRRIGIPKAKSGA